MAYYSLNDAKQQIRESNGMLVAPSLLVTLLFCYAFVLMQPHANRRIETASSREATPTSQSQSDLTVKAYDKQSTLNTLPDTKKPTTATPQPTIDATTSLQAASARDGKGMVIHLSKRNRSNYQYRQSDIGTSWLRKAETDLFQF